MLEAAALVGSAGRWLRAPVTSVISCSDASEMGESASEAHNILRYRSHKLENEVELARAALLESSAQDNTVHECSGIVSQFIVCLGGCVGGCCESTCLFLHVQLRWASTCWRKILGTLSNQ